MLLMSMDIWFATLRCYQTARKQYSLPTNFSVKNTLSKISHFGRGYEPVSSLPKPQMLRYKSTTPVSIYSSGIEKVVLSYNSEHLDKAEYDSILCSAKANSESLKGKGKHFYLDKSQKKSPLNRVTVVFIFAKTVDEKLSVKLYNTLCKGNGDGFDNALIPCVIDIEKRICTFDSLRIPYSGFQYPVKNRGVRIVRKCIFGNRLPVNSEDYMLDFPKDYNPEQSLWSFWRETKTDLGLEVQKDKKLFAKMNHRDVIRKDGYIYVKWEERGVLIMYETDDDFRVAKVDEFSWWDYPRMNRMAKATVKEIKNLLSAHFAEEGYAIKYISYEE